MKKNVVYAKDQLLSRAIQLPHNLTIEANSTRGKFEIQFLALLSNKDLSLLKKIGNGYGKDISSISLEFFTVVDGSEARPTLLKKFNNYRWEDLLKIQISKSQPYQEHADTPAKHYISVTLVTKN